MHTLNIDVTSIMIVDMMMGFTLTGLLALCLRDKILCPGMKLWSLGFLAWSCGLLAMFLRVFVPLWISVSVGNTLIAVGYCLIWLGTRHYKKIFSFSDLRVFGFIPFYFLLLVFLSNTENDVYFAQRSCFISIVVALLAWMNMSELMRQRRENETGRILCTIAFGISFLLMLYRMVSVLSPILPPVNLLGKVRISP